MIKHDSLAAAQRVAQACSAVFEERCWRVYGDFMNYCDSPIEAMLGTAVFVTLDLFDGIIVKVITDYTEIDKDGGCFIIPQFKWKQYLVDFALFIKLDHDSTCIFIECDGHDFHERTKEQAEHDRKKDREIQASGTPILRFTGSEIYRDVSACVTTIINFLLDRWNRKCLESAR